jgi:hypothetical protein
MTGMSASTSASGQLNTGGNGDGHAGCGEERQAQGRNASREHMVDPQAETEEARCNQGNDYQSITNERRARQCRHDRRNESGGRQEADVDLRVTEEPEQVLPEKGVAASSRSKERPTEGTLDFEKHRCQNYRGERDHNHSGENQHRPTEDR